MNVPTELDRLVRDAAAAIPPMHGADLARVLRRSRARRRRVMTLNLAAVALLVVAAAGTVQLVRPSPGPPPAQPVGGKRLLMTSQPPLDSIAEVMPDGTVRLIRVPGLTPPLKAIALPDGRIAVKSASRMVMLAPDGSEMFARDLQGKIVAATNRALILNTSDNDKLIAHDIETGTEVVLRSGAVAYAYASADRLVIWGNTDPANLCTVSLLDPQTGASLGTVRVPGDTCVFVSYAMISPDGRLLAVNALGKDHATRSNLSQVVILDAATGAVQKEFPPVPWQGPPTFTAPSGIFTGFDWTDDTTLKHASAVVPIDSLDRLNEAIQITTYRL